MPSAGGAAEPPARGAIRVITGWLPTSRPRPDRRRPPPAGRALGRPAGLVKVDCQDGATALGKDHRRRSCGLTSPPREEDDDGAGATAVPSGAQSSEQRYDRYTGLLFLSGGGGALVILPAARVSALTHTGLGAMSRIRCGDGPISVRITTDLEPEFDRSRGGMRPISTRKGTDLGERGGWLGRLIVAVACGGPVPTMKSCARRPRGRRGGPSARRRHRPAAIARIQRIQWIQKLAPPPPVCLAEARAVVVSC